MSDSTSEELPEDLSRFTDIDPYEVLGLDPAVADQITETQIKKAYRLKALKCHPDKAKTDSERTEFHALFQTVALAYSVLGDERRRKRYDATGSMEDAARDEGEGEDMKQFFADLWKAEITEEMIENDKQVYRNSGEEKADVLKYYLEGEGSMQVVMENVLHTTDEDEERLRAMIQAAIDAGEVEAFAAFTKKESKAAKLRRKAAAKKEAAEAEELSKELGLDKTKAKGGKKKGDSDEGSLLALIQGRSQKRMASLIEGLEAKYGGSASAGEPSKKKKKVASEPSEDEFLRIQAELEESRRSNKKASKIKAKKSTRSGRK